MSKTKKILYLILCILILTILIPILLDYHKVSGLGLHLVDWKQISFLDFYLSRYIFWGALVLSAVVWFLMLVTLFYPKQYLEIQLPDVDGNLKLKNSAIEGFVRCVVANHNFIKDPTIKVNCRKNKCLVHVEGQMLPSDNIIKRTQIIKDEIADGLKQFFGMNHRVKLYISVKEYKPKPPRKKTVSRVKSGSKKMEWFKKYQYPFLSGLAGAILACFILSYGFFKTLFVLICAILGVGIGYYIQQKQLFK